MQHHFLRPYSTESLACGKSEQQDIVDREQWKQYMTTTSKLPSLLWQYTTVRPNVCSAMKDNFAESKLFLEDETRSSDKKIADGLKRSCRPNSTCSFWEQPFAQQISLPMDLPNINYSSKCCPFFSHIISVVKLEKMSRIL